MPNLILETGNFIAIQIWQIGEVEDINIPLQRVKLQ